jgi:hypothetical protein
VRGKRKEVREWREREEKGSQRKELEGRERKSGKGVRGKRKEVREGSEREEKRSQRRE